MVYLTIQKAVNIIGNRFDLVLIASYRARQIQLYSKELLYKNKDKPILIALKEIENNIFDKKILNKFYSKS